jgi:hypothetical protein
VNNFSAVQIWQGNGTTKIGNSRILKIPTDLIIFYIDFKLERI